MQCQCIFGMLSGHCVLVQLTPSLSLRSSRGFCASIVDNTQKYVAFPPSSSLFLLVSKSPQWVIRPFSRLSSPHPAKLQLMIHLLAMFVKKRLVNSHTIKNFYVANFANPTFLSKSASCSRWTSWHRSGSPSQSACTIQVQYVWVSVGHCQARTCSTPWERTSSQCPTC